MKGHHALYPYVRATCLVAEADRWVDLDRVARLDLAPLHAVHFSLWAAPHMCGDVCAEVCVVAELRLRHSACACPKSDSLQFTYSSSLYRTNSTTPQILDEACLWMFWICSQEMSRGFRKCSSAERSLDATIRVQMLMSYMCQTQANWSDTIEFVASCFTQLE